MNTAPASNGLATPDPEQPVPVVADPPTAGGRWLLIPGFGVLVACFLAGEAIKRACGLILPGNILGLFILLALLFARIVPLRWVEAAARLLLFLLPLLFVPIFVLAFKKTASLPQNTGYLAAVLVGVLFLWAGVGHLAQRMLNRRTHGNVSPHRDPSP